MNISDEGREYLAALAMGDERAEAIQRCHKLSVESAQRLVERSMDHYRYCKEADFQRAAESLQTIVRASTALLEAHRALIGEERSEQ